MRDDIIYIKAVAKRNAITCLSLGLMGVLLVSVMLAFLPDAFFLAGIFLLSASIVCFLVGWFKLREPEYSFLLSRDSLKFAHRKGEWRLPWSNIQRVDCPRLSYGVTPVELEVVGVKVRDYRVFLDTLSPRLAMHLLIEQRPLLMHALRASCQSGACYDSHFLNDDSYLLANGERIKGIKAMFANRMMQLREHYGVDLLIAASDLDREPIAFVELLRHCQRAAVSEALNG